MRKHKLPWTEPLYLDGHILICVPENHLHFAEHFLNDLIQLIWIIYPSGIAAHKFQVTNLPWKGKQSMQLKWEPGWYVRWKKLPCLV
ncbi:MAG TPA: hypothetical protein PKK76_11875 [Leptospiraceae bacterium]|nr:hypothetical protein [Leptospiraceae bacterium]